MKKKLLKPEAAAVALAAAIIVSLLMVKPIIGVADNGDFGRIMGSTGLEYMSNEYNDKYFGYMNREYRVKDSRPFGGGYFSTEIALVELAKLVNNIISFKTGIFDIRFLAAIYSYILMTAIYLGIRFNRQDIPFTNWILSALAVFMFTDVGYISYFNSLYGEAVSFTFLLLTFVMILCLSKQESPRISTLVVFFTASIFLTGAKAQNVPIGIILALFGIRLLFLRKDILWRSLAVVFSIALVLTSAAAYKYVPGWIKVCNKYQTVFFGITKDSPDPGKDLEELGINKKYTVLAGTNYFMPSYPINIKSQDLTEEIDTKVNSLKVASFYVTHPGRFVRKLEVSAKNGFKMIQGWGNYEKGDNVEYKKTVDALATWSRIKSHALPHSLTFIAFLFLAYFSVLVIGYARQKTKAGKLYLEAFMLIGILGMVQFLVPVIGDGEADLSKHLFLFNACFDVMLAASIVWLVHNITRLVVKLKRKLEGGIYT